MTGRARSERTEPPIDRGRRAGGRPPHRRRRALWLAAAAAPLLAAVAVALAYGPALVLTLALAVPALEPWLGAGAPPVAREPASFVVHGRAVQADLYRGGFARGGLVLVHGLSPAGRRHAEMVRVATLLAARGQVVLVPHFEGLAAFRLTGREVEEVRGAMARLRPLVPSLGVVGFSFGAGPVLLAAAEEPDLRVAACFGGYAHLRHVIAFITTGAHGFAGARHVAPQEEYNRWKLLALLESFVSDPGDRARVAALARVRLDHPGADARALEAQLGPEGRAILDLVENRREDEVDRLIGALPPAARAALDRLSPSSAVGRIRGRLLIAHGADDPSIPFTESLRLGEAAGGTARVVILGGFHHTGPGVRAAAWRALDGWRLVPLLDELLAARAMP